MHHSDIEFFKNNFINVNKFFKVFILHKNVLSKIIGLYFRGNGICAIPEEITYLKKIKYFMCKYNNLIRIPKEVCMLNNLHTLILSHNNIDTIPSEIYKLQKLRIFNCSNNKLINIPNKFFLLNLYCFDFSYNTGLKII